MMEYDAIRCVEHGNEINTLKNFAIWAKNKIRGDGNGNKGYDIRLDRLEDFKKLLEENEARKQRKYDRLSVALIIQAVAFFLFVFKDFIIK
jgi:hypothetical protein